MTKKKIKKTAKKLEVKKASPKKGKKKSLIKRIDENEVSIKMDPLKVKTEIIVNDGVVVVNPIYNPFDENNKD